MHQRKKKISRAQKNKNFKEKRKYIPSWEDEFDWVAPDVNNVHKALCTKCNRSFDAAKYILIKHHRRKHAIKDVEVDEASEADEKSLITQYYESRDCKIVPASDIVEDVCMKDEKNDAGSILNSIPCPKSSADSDIVEDVCMKDEKIDFKIEPDDTKIKCCKEEDDMYKKTDEYLSQLNNVDTSKKVKDKDMRQFKPSWLKDPRYGSWCRPVPHNNHLALCIHCRHTMSARAWYLNKHMESAYHQFNANDVIVPGRNFDPQVADMEIRCAALIADMNFSHLGSDKLFGFFKNTVDDSAKLRNAVLNRRRTLAIQKRVIAPAHQDRLAKILRKSKFAIEVDEATDVSSDHAMCIVVRYYDPARKKVCDSLWDLKQLYVGDENESANAQTIFDNICASFAEWEIPLRNIFAFCSDTCSVMMGKVNSVAALLKQVIPGILIVKCDCHIEHLCAKDATKKIPLNNFPSMVYNYMNSSKKKHIWEVCQIKFNLYPLQILKPTCIRWLSQYRCILRLLRRWKALTIFFENEVIEGNSDKKDKAAEILEHLRNPVNKAYHMFLEAQLSKLVRTNEVLQYEKPIVPKSMSMMQQLYIDLLNTYMNTDYVARTPMRNIDPKNEAEFKNLNDINIGYHTRQFLKNEAIFNDDVEKEFRTVCQQFYIEACSKLRKRCNLQNNDSFVSKFFNVENALSQNFHHLHPDLKEAFITCPVLVESDSNLENIINAEWNRLITYNFPHIISSEKDPDVFWAKVKDIQEEGDFLFDNLATFALQILCIPNSNAAPERVWSKFNLEKTKIRNRLHFSSIRAILLTAQYVHDQGGINFFQPTPEMIRRMARPLGVRIPNPKPSFPTYKMSDSEAKIYFGKLKFEEDTVEECNLEDRLYRSPYTDLNLPEDLTLHSKDVVIVHDGKRKRAGNDDDDYESAMKKLKLDGNERKLWLIYGHDHDYLSKNDAVACIKGITRSKKCKPVTPPIYPNGLISDLNKYKNVKGQIAIGQYTAIDNHPIRDYRFWVDKEGNKREYGINHTFSLFSDAFKTLFGVGREGYIDGDVIDAFCAIRERRWKNAYCCPVNISNIICTTWAQEPVEEDWGLLYIKPNFTGKLFFPYTLGFHWCVFVADLKKKHCYHLDPQEIDKSNKYIHDVRHYGLVPSVSDDSKTRDERCFDNFMAYRDRSNQKGKNALSGGSWKLIANPSDRNKQEDGFNCGIHMLHDIDRLGRGLPLKEKKFDPAKCRIWIAELLLQNSESMALTCLFCFDDQNQEDLTVRCRTCNRAMHQTCLDNAGLTITDKCLLCATEIQNNTNVENNVKESECTNNSTAQGIINETSEANPKDDSKKKSKGAATSAQAIKPVTYANGLNSDVEKYRNVVHQITVGRYSTIKNHPIRDYRPPISSERMVRRFGVGHEFLLFSKEFKKLFCTGEEGYIDGEIIDAFCAIRERKWKNVYCCPVNIGSIMCVTWNERPPDNEWTMFHIKPNFTGKILFPYSEGLHWRVFVVDIHKKQCWLLDPLYIGEPGIISKDAQQIFNNFMGYCERSKIFQVNTFNKSSWTLVSNCSPRATQDDNFNCGIHILHDMDRIGRGVPLKEKTPFNPAKYRSMVAKTLIENSDSMASTCLFCFSDREREITVICSKCNRSMHTTCLNNRQLQILDRCILCLDDSPGSSNTINEIKSNAVLQNVNGTNNHLIEK